MPAATGITVHGLRELNRALKTANKETKREVRESMERVARPVQLDAQKLAATEISGIRRTNLVSGGEWALMRIGVTSKLVYVAPKQRGKKQGSQKRRNLAPLLMGKAMEPALENNRHRFEHDVEQALDRMAAHFNGGPIG